MTELSDDRGKQTSPLPPQARWSDASTLVLDNQGAVGAAFLFAAAALLTLCGIGAAAAMLSSGAAPGTTAAAAAMSATSMAAVLAAGGIRRMRSMGQFFIDIDSRTLRVGRDAVTVPLGQIRISEKVDLLERNPAALVHGQRRWVIATLPDGRALRLAKGYPKEATALVNLLADAGAARPR